MTITRHFVTLDGRWGTRQVHYRRAGSGPAVLLLHQSPQSSRDMLDLMPQWAGDFTLIAPDTPGYGQSDPLPGGPRDMADLAAATLEFADALGLRRFGIYGYHTGASIGTWMAAAAPARVGAVAAHGLATLTPAERSDILAHYLPPVEPRWDGSHLAWLWSRIREQTVFFPWYRAEAATRMTLDMPGADRLQVGVVEMLRAGVHYGSAYRVAFESRPAEVLPGMRVPLLVTTGGGDPLAAHLDRIRTASPAVQVVVSASFPESLSRCRAHLLAHPGDAAPPPPATKPVAGRWWSRMLPVEAGEVHLRQRDGDPGRPQVLVHGAGGSAQLMLHAGGHGGATRLLPDLPGHGESSPWPGDPLAAATAALATVGEAAGGACDLLARGAGGAAALELLPRLAQASLTLEDVPCCGDDERAAWLRHAVPDLTPQWHGGHLLAGWHYVRDSRLFDPWFDRRGVNAIPGDPDVDPADVQAELTELLKAGPDWGDLQRAAIAYPWREQLARHPGRVRLAAAPGRGLARSQRLAQSVPGVPFTVNDRAAANGLPAGRAD